MVRQAPFARLLVGHAVGVHGRVDAAFVLIVHCDGVTHLRRQYVSFAHGEELLKQYKTHAMHAVLRGRAPLRG